MERRADDDVEAREEILGLTMSEVSSPFRRDCLVGKVAIVTGGGSGICFEITRQLLLHGCAGAVICGRREAFLQRACQQLGRNALYQACDVRDPQQCRRVVDYCMSQFGRVDILVNGAAGNFLAEASALSPKGFRTVMEIDTLGTYHMTHACYPSLKQSKKSTNPSSDGMGGIVINISATLQYGATWYQVHASAAKSAVDSMTRTWALEWGTDQIRVVGIAPGAVKDTPGTTKLAPFMEEIINDAIPLGRMANKAEIGLVAVFLCSSAGAYITGDTVVVDGAQWLFKPPVLPREMVAEMSRKVESKSRSQGLAVRSKL